MLQNGKPGSNCSTWDRVYQKIATGKLVSWYRLDSPLRQPLFVELKTLDAGSGIKTEEKDGAHIVMNWENRFQGCL